MGEGSGGSVQAASRTISRGVATIYVQSLSFIEAPFPRSVGGMLSAGLLLHLGRIPNHAKLEIGLSRTEFSLCLVELRRRPESLQNSSPTSGDLGWPQTTAIAIATTTDRGGVPSWCWERRHPAGMEAQSLRLRLHTRDLGSTGSVGSSDHPRQVSEDFPDGSCTSASAVTTGPSLTCPGAPGGS